MSEPRLIDANVVMEKLREKYLATDPGDPEQLGYLNARIIVRNQPTIEAVPVVHGAWETSQLYDADGNTVYIHRHRECGYESHGYKEHGTPYCPNCGAKMEGGGS